MPFHRKKTFKRYRRLTKNFQLSKPTTAGQENQRFLHLMFRYLMKTLAPSAMKELDRLMARNHEYQQMFDECLAENPVELFPLRYLGPDRLFKEVLKSINKKQVLPTWDGPLHVPLHQRLGKAKPPSNSPKETQWPHLMIKYLQGSLTPQERRRLRRHTTTSPLCREEYLDLTDPKRFLKDRQAIRNIHSKYTWENFKLLIGVEDPSTETVEVTLADSALPTTPIATEENPSSTP